MPEPTFKINHTANTESTNENNIQSHYYSNKCKL